MANTLKAGQSMKHDQQLVSSNGKFVLTMQPDGNLALYQGAPNAGAALWTAASLPFRAWSRPSRADMQNDGRLVLYHSGGFPIWNAGVSGDYPNSRLVLQDDGNLVIFDQDNTQLWASNTSVVSKAVRELVEHASTYVGNGKYMDTTVRLYRNGTLSVDSYTRNEAWFEGLRGQILVICSDGNGNAHWVSDVLYCDTRCAAGDPTCSHEGRENFINNFPEAVGQYTEQLEIMQADNANYPDVRARLVDFIKATREVLEEVKAVWDLLQRF